MTRTRFRKAKTDESQQIIVHGREEEHRRVKGEPTGQALVTLLHDSPLGDITIERSRTRGRVRGIEL